MNQSIPKKFVAAIAVLAFVVSLGCGEIDPDSTADGDKDGDKTEQKDN